MELGTAHTEPLLDPNESKEAGVVPPPSTYCFSSFTNRDKKSCWPGAARVLTPVRVRALTMDGAVGRSTLPSAAGQPALHRSWRVIFDGATAAAGEMHRCAGGASLRYTVRCTAFTQSGGLRRLCDPLSLGSELLSRVVELLPLRDRLLASRVSKGWRRALAVAALFERLDLSAGSLPGNPRAGGINARVLACLRVHGAKLTELRLGDQRGLTDDTLLAVARSCPRLKLLDLRGCTGVFTDADERGLGRDFMEAINTLFARAAPGSSFTLLLFGSGFMCCEGCGVFCGGLRDPSHRAFETLCSLRAPPGGAGGGEPWLQMDVARCAGGGDECDGGYFGAEVDALECDGTPLESNDDNSFVCSSCYDTVCDNCMGHVCNDGCGHHNMFCSICTELEAVATCALCSSTMAECCLESAVRCCAPGCGVLVCGDCSYDDEKMPGRCDRCPSRACASHAAVCCGCCCDGDPSKLSPAFRATSRCCSCGADHCFMCDAGADGEAGTVAGARRLAGDDCATDTCMVCASWPKSCGGWTALAAARDERPEVDPYVLEDTVDAANEAAAAAETAAAAVHDDARLADAAERNAAAAEAAALVETCSPRKRRAVRLAAVLRRRARAAAGWAATSAAAADAARENAGMAARAAAAAAQEEGLS